MEFKNNPEEKAENKTVIPVVSGKEEEGKRGKNKKMKFLIGAIIIIAVIIAAAAIISGAAKKKNEKPAVQEASGAEAGTEEEEEKDTAPVTFSEDIEFTLEGVSADYEDMLQEHAFDTSVTTQYKPESATIKPQTNAVSPEKKPDITTEKYIETTTVKTDIPAASSEKAIDVIRAFFSGKYYFDGEMISGGNKTVLEIAMDGEDFEAFTEFEKKDIAMMKIGGKLYMLNPDTMKYTEFSSAVQKMMGIDESAFRFEFNSIKCDADKPYSVTQAKYNGEDAVCYTYKTEEKTMEFTAVDEEIKQLAVYGKDGSASMALKADEFTGEIPGDMLTLQGYSKTNMISFFSALM